MNLRLLLFCCFSVLYGQTQIPGFLPIQAGVLPCGVVKRDIYTVQAYCYKPGAIPNLIGNAIYFLDPDKSTNFDFIANWDDDHLSVRVDAQAGGNILVTYSINGVIKPPVILDTVFGQPRAACPHPVNDIIVLADGRKATASRWGRSGKNLFECISWFNPGFGVDQYCCDF